mgnify:CR=1 FL=1
MVNDLKIVFMGTPEFGATILLKMINSDISPFLVVTNPDKPAGRGKKIQQSIVADVASKNSINVFKPQTMTELEDKMKEVNPDLIVIASYGKIISKNILDIPKYKTINVHPSLLPQYRGPAPIQYAILNNDKKTGVTIMLVEEEMDSGDILKQKEVVLKDKITYQELSGELALIGGDLLVKTIPDWVSGKIQPKKQGPFPTYTKILDRFDGRIDWKDPAEKIERQIRAFSPWPGAYAYQKDKIIKVLDADVLEQTRNGPFGTPGKVYLGSNETIVVQTGKDFLVIKEFQLEGKKAMKTEEYLRGNNSLIGVVLK